MELLNLCNGLSKFCKTKKLQEIFIGDRKSHSNIQLKTLNFLLQRQNFISYEKI